MNKPIKKLMEVESDNFVNGYLIRRRDNFGGYSDMHLACNKDELREAFDKCYWLGDRENASKGGKISNPIFENYFNEFINNYFVSMPNDAFVLVEVEIPLWKGKAQGYYYENDKLHDMYSLYRLKPTGECII